MCKRKKVTFKNYCDPLNKRLKKVMRMDNCIYTETLDFIIDDYNSLTLKEINTPRMKNNAVVAFFDDAINTFDGICVLHGARAIRAAYPLVRKLMEVYIQLKFLLCGDTGDKALAYEAYYESRGLKGKDDFNSTLHKWPKYKLYKKEADIAFSGDKKPKFEEWYTMYDRVKRKGAEEISDNSKSVKKTLRNFRDLCKRVNEEDLYNEYYSALSKEAHGRLGRDLIKDVKDKAGKNLNYVENFRNPEGLYFQTWFCSDLMRKMYCLVCYHYSFPVKKQSLDAQIEKLKKLKELKDKYLANEL